VGQGATALTELKLTRNQLTGTLSPAISALCRLKTLDMCQNRLTNLPAELGHCTALVEINLGFNRLTSLPQELGQLAALQTLDLRNNLYACLTRSVLAFGCAGYRLWVFGTTRMSSLYAVCWQLGVPSVCTSMNEFTFSSPWTSGKPYPRYRHLRLGTPKL
jgi:hypothetical protein